MLTRLAIKNFKSIGDPGVDLELKPLTFLVGPNGSGKSSVLEELTWLAGSVDDPRSPHLPHYNWSAFLSDGMRQMHSKPGPTVTTFELTAEGITYHYHVEDRGTYSEAILKNEQELLADHHLLFPEGHLRSERRRDGGEWYQVSQRTQSAPPNIQPVWFRMNTVDLGHVAAEIAFMQSVLSRVYPILSSRGEVPQRATAQEPPNWVGSRGEAVIVLLERLRETGRQHIAANISKWGERFGLQDLSAVWHRQNEFAGNYVDPVLGVSLNVALSSFSSRQVLPIILEAFWNDADSVITIEEPEISLHPQAQVDMTELLATAAAEGKQILATTHSTFMLLGIGKVIRNPEVNISSEGAAIYEINKGREGSRAKRLPLDRKGNLKGWTNSSFGKIERELLREWSSSLPKV